MPVIETARAVDAGDARMAEPSEQFDLVFDSGEHVFTADARPQDFEGDVAVGVVLLGLVDDTHAARAEMTQDAASADGASDERVLQWLGRGHMVRGDGLVVAKQRAEFLEQVGFASDIGPQERLPCRRREFNGRVEEFPAAAVAICGGFRRVGMVRACVWIFWGGHQSSRSSSRRSHARA